MALNEQQLHSIIDDLIERFQYFSAPDSTRNFYDRVMQRRRTFHNQVPTRFTGRLASMTPFESDSPRQKWSELRARLVENHFVVRVKPVKDTATQRSDANEVEAGLNAGIGLVEARNGYLLQEALADAQIIDGVGVLHWRKAADLYPDYPEAEQIVELPEREDDRKRYSERRKGGYYVEKPESVRERRALDCAKAGFPWLIEVPDVLSVLWDEDEFGLSMVALVKEISLLTYVQELSETALSAAEAGSEEGGYRARSLIADMSNINPSNRALVCTLWTRDRWYELVLRTTSGRLQKSAAWELVKGGEHYFGEPPFALVPAARIQNRPPEEAFMPALEGMFRLKAGLDRSVSLMLGLQEQSSIGMYMLVRTGSGEPMLGEDGAPVTLSSDAASAYKVPDGYELKELRADVSQGFVQSVTFLKEEYDAAGPKTGRAEIGASSSPWSVRFALEQENVEPRSLMQNQLRAFQKMARSIARCMSQETEPTYIFARVTNGRVDEERLLALEPKRIGSLDIDADIDPTSQAERVSLIEHGSALLERGLIDDIDFLSNYMKMQNPDRYYAQREAWKIFKEQVQPALLSQETARLLSQLVVLGPNGTFVGPGGQAVPPEQVLQQQGGTNPPPAQPMGGVQGGGAMAPTLPDLPDLQPPNMLPQQGMPG